MGLIGNHYGFAFWLGSEGDRPRYSTTDHWILESIKRILNSGLFWAVGAAEKKNPNCHKYATFEVNFLMISWPKNSFRFF